MSSAVVRRDASCRAVVAGSYMLTMPGAKPVLVDVFEDEACDLWLRSKQHERPQRVDEVSEDATFHRVTSVDAGEIRFDSAVDEVDYLLGRAVELRQSLRTIEDHVCTLLHCETGDGSPLADAVCAAVRDGVGSAIELADLAGCLRR